MSAHYLPRVSVNVVSQRPERKPARARKRPVDTLSITYSELKKAFFSELYRLIGLKPSSLPNMRSAIRAFMAERGFTDDTVVGSALRQAYWKHLGQHLTQLRTQGRNSDYISNRKGLLASWRRALLEADRQSAAGLKRATPFQSALRELIDAGRTIKGTAKAAGVPLATFRRWLEGAQPNSRSVKYVPRLERHFGIPTGGLSDLVPQALHVGPFVQEVSAPNEYRARLRVLSGKPYVLKAASDSLRSEWRDFLAYKMVAGHPRNKATGEVMKRQPRTRWTGTTAPVVKAGPSRWFAFHQGMYVATAAMRWAMAAEFLGWLALSPEDGGCGFAESEGQTLAYLARVDLLERYVDWRVARAGGREHQGIVTFLRFVTSLCHPSTGYLTQSWRVFARHLQIETEDAWRQTCNETYESFSEKRKDIEHAGRRRSREPFEPIKGVLALPNPLDAVADAVARLDAARPLTGGVSEAIWARDRLLLKLLASNPLRDENLRMLTYHADGSGQLSKTHEGWKIHIPKEQLKNLKGAAKDRDYDMPVRPEVWPDIEQYLRDYRPQLAGEGNPYVFVSAERSSGPMYGLGRRFAYLTKRYLAGCPGVGPQAMRHIVATSILKANPGAWTAAAWALHDLPETVEEHYAHLRPNDAARWMESTMRGPFSRM